MCVVQEVVCLFEDMLKLLYISMCGFIYDQVVDCLQQYGLNEIVYDKLLYWMWQLLFLFYNLFVYVLLVLVVISFFIDVYFVVFDECDYVGMMILLMMVMISVLLCFVQEFCLLCVVEKFKVMVCMIVIVQCVVIDMVELLCCEVLMCDVVVGDIVYFFVGDMIFVDVWLFVLCDLFISQVVLIGEVLFVEKYDMFGVVVGKFVGMYVVSVVNGVLVLLFDFENVCFMGINVVSGMVMVVVVVIGEEIYFGLFVCNVVSYKCIEMSFDCGVVSVSWLLIKFMFVMVLIVFMINGLIKGDWLSVFMFVFVVVVGFMFEMLLMIVSVNFVCGVVVMVCCKVVVKWLNLVQNFGVMDVLCIDKIGMFMQDKIIFEYYFDLFGYKNEDILWFGWLNSFYQSGQKNLIDIVVVVCVDEIGECVKLQGYKKIDELLFDFVWCCLLVVVEDMCGMYLLICKGVVEEMLVVLMYVQDEDGVCLFDYVVCKWLFEQVIVYNEDGFCVFVFVMCMILCGDECV